MYLLFLYLFFLNRINCINDGKGWDNASDIGRQSYEELEDIYENICGAIFIIVGLVLIFPIKRWLKLKLIIMGTFGYAFPLIIILSQLLNFAENKLFYLKIGLISFCFVISGIGAYFACRKPIILIAQISCLSGLLVGMTIIRMGILSYPLGRTIFTICLGICGMMLGLSFKGWVILVCINWIGVELIFHGIDLAIEFGYVQFNQIGWHRIYEAPPPLINGLIFLSIVCTLFMVLIRYKLIGRESIDDISSPTTNLEELDTNSAFSIEIKIDS